MIPQLPLTYLGNLEYFYYLVKHPKVHLDAHEVYQKQTFRNRCVIVGPNGKLNLSVPVERPNGKLTKTKDVLISYNENWQHVHWKTLESCYNRSPYFEFYADQLKTILLTKFKTLAELNLTFIRYLIDKLGVDCELIQQFDEEPDSILNLMTHFSPKIKSKFNSYPYLQTFTERHGHVPNLSILDLLFNEGSNSICILEESSFSVLNND